MLINYVPGEECRVALVVDGLMEEFQAERTNAVTLVGNIYVARVVNVEPSIQAAFVDFGQGANGFLHVSDLHPQYFPGEDQETTERVGHKTPRRERPPIQACLRRGQEILVQVLKEGISTKGPTLTSYLSIPGKYLVMLPQMDRVGVSRRVEDDEQRRAMREVLDQLELPEGFGFIVRTAGMDRGKVELKRDLAYLQRLWKDIEARMKHGSQPRLLYAESDLLMRCLRDTWTSEISEIIIDNSAALQRAARFMKIIAPRCATRLLQYDRPTPMFHAYGIEEQLARLHAREVPLPSGGGLIIDEAEAMVVIDVNSGKMRDNRDAETTAFKTNMEAVDEICRQVKLRDVGGLILCDFIDMSSRKNRRDVENRIKDRLKKDRASTKPLPISEFGIVEMTRQRVRGSYRSQHFAKCPACNGRGLLRRPESVAADALRELALLLDVERIQKVELVVSPRVAGELLSARRLALWRLEHTFKKHVDVRVSEDIPVDQIRLYAYDENGADVDIDTLPAPRPPKKLVEIALSTEKDTEWAVDSVQELPEGLMHEPEAVASPMDEALAAAESADINGPDIDFGHPVGDRAERDDAEGGEAGRRRRRRRRGRGRGRGVDGAEAPAAAPAAAPAPAVRPAAAAPMAEGGEEGANGTGRKRRRRRRGRGRGAPGEMVEADGATLAKPAIPAPVELAPGQSRGDSWDLDPGAVVPLRPPVVLAPAEIDEDVEAEDELDPALDRPAEAEGDTQPAADDGGAVRKRRRRRRGRGKDKVGVPAPIGEPEAGEPMAAVDAPEREQESGAEPALVNGAPAPDGKKRRRRRGGRGGAKAGDGAEPAAPPAPARAPAASTGAKAPTKPVVVRTPIAPAKAPKVDPLVGTMKPARTLYSNRRRLPGGAASAGPRRDE